MDKIFINTDIEVKAPKDEDRTLEFIATKEVVDRDGDVVKVDGIDVRSFKKNPVLLWAHDHRGLPIGKVVKIVKDAGQLIMKVKFAEPEIYGFADTVYKLLKAGYLKAVSIGFIPDFDQIEYPKDKKIRGKVVRRVMNLVELLELSVVPVPANQEALSTGKMFQKAIADNIVDDLEVREFIEKSKEVQDNLKSAEETKQEFKSMEDTIVELKAQVAELELQLKEQEMEEEVEDDLYGFLFDEDAPGSQASAKEEHTDEHTDDELGLDDLFEK